MWRVRAFIKPSPLKGDKTGPVIGIVPITEHLSEKKLAKISGNKKVQMIPQKDLQKTTGYVHGANNPVGIRQKHNFPIYIDQFCPRSWLPHCLSGGNWAFYSYQ